MHVNTPEEKYDKIDIGQLPMHSYKDYRRSFWQSHVGPRYVRTDRRRTWELNTVTVTNMHRRLLHSSLIRYSIRPDQRPRNQIANPETVDRWSGQPLSIPTQI